MRLRRWVPLAAALALLAAAGPLACQRTCEGCSGCCDEGECLSGNAPGACGRGGATCVACSSGDSCTAGVCGDAPDAGPLDAGRPRCLCATGCCREDGGCAAGNLPETCGTTGRACVTCDAGLSCPRGVCEDTRGCQGCFDALGLCRPGDTESTCGRGGALCRGCVGTDQCVNGQCVGTSSCGAASCPSGCCASTNTCVPPSSSQCGLQGSPCFACPTGSLCTNGACQ